MALAVCSLGCRSDPYQDAYLEMLNAEKRALEDRLYETEYNYEQALAKLESVKASDKDDGKTTSRTRSGSSPQPRVESEDELPEESPELPTIELPPGVEAGARNPADGAPTAQRKTGTPLVLASAVPASAARPLSDQELAAAIVDALDQRVEAIQLNPRLTHGVDFDGVPGDDGISVLIEPRNRSGGFVPETGRISIVLLDPAQADDAAARIARWDFEADSIRKFLQTDSLDSGVLLRLPWQDKVPDRKRLHLFVRYLTEDGRKLETDRPIEIESADLIAQRWTPRPSPSPERAQPREAMANWLPKDEAAAPAAAQAAAEQPITPAPASPPEQPAAKTKAAQAVEAAPQQPGLLEPAAAKPLTPKAADSDTAKAEDTAEPEDKPGSADKAAAPRPFPTGQFWKPDR
jgi:hypothetical protein